MDVSALLNRLPPETLAGLRGFVRVYAKAGWQCLLVGGSLRDLILGEIPKDFDFATNCPLEETRKLFKKVIPTGVEHGTLTILFAGMRFEVTRFRKDIEQDGRRAKVIFADSWQEDQERRDLTLNALACDLLQERFLDHQGALADFAQKRLRFVGDAGLRVREDHLRALRYLRMSARFIPLGFGYDPVELKRVLEVFDPAPLSMERILDEISKIFLHPFALGFLLQTMPFLRLFRKFLKPVEEEACLRAWLTLQNPLPLAYYGLLAGVKPEELRLPRRLINLGRLLLRFRQADWASEVVAKDFLHQALPEDLEPLSQGAKEILQVDLSPLLRRIKQKNEPLYLRQLKLQAKDLIPLGLTGKALGQAMNALLREVWANPKNNDPRRLREILRKERTNLIH